MRFTDRTLPRGVLLFWSLWLSIVTLTNVLDGLKNLRLLPTGWAFASGNYAFMASVTAKYHTPAAATALLFVGVVLWELLASALFWRAFAAYRAGRAGEADAARTAFTVSLALWAAFALADEIFFAFDAEATHFRLFIATIASLLAICVLAPAEEDGATEVGRP
ncbi:MAG: hypothetical protein JWM27_1727 [Gemmatimonadetes bacterium]|nr:hypothetical protein [Gemmatimonadota bacterium]